MKRKALDWKAWLALKASFSLGEGGMSVDDVPCRLKVRIKGTVAIEISNAMHLISVILPLCIAQCNLNFHTACYHCLN
jgi:hypothetical protein